MVVRAVTIRFSRLDMAGWQALKSNSLGSGDRYEKSEGEETAWQRRELLEQPSELMLRAQNRILRNHD